MNYIFLINKISYIIFRFNNNKKVQKQAKQFQNKVKYKDKITI